MGKQPSLIKIVRIDIGACLGVLLPAGMWGIYIVLLISKDIKPMDVVFPLILAILTIIPVGILVWRVQVINAVFGDGIEVMATIKDVVLSRGRGRISYRYAFQGREYESGAYVVVVEEVRAVEPGGQMIVLVDRNNPERAFIRDLYT